jgi:hypothetical protein
MKMILSKKVGNIHALKQLFNSRCSKLTICKKQQLCFSEQKSQTKSLVAQGGGTILMF